jgi:ADP-ribosyl-[dinitrogen reductase] hydrolase
MLLELAIGDAYGAGFEYVDRDAVAVHNNLARYMRHPRHRIAPGRYTDDMQMSIAVVEAILSDAPWTPLLLADWFVEAFRRDPREGYSAGFYDFLHRVSSGAQFLAEIRPESDKSGAAMRAAPIGVYPTVAEVIERATVQARLTHDTLDGIHAAVAAALMPPKPTLAAIWSGTSPASGRRPGVARSRAKDP